MHNHRVPKISLFSWLLQTRPKGGPRKRCRDVIRKDLKEIGVPKNKWYEKARTSKASKRNVYRTAIDNEVDQHQKQQQHTSSDQPLQTSPLGTVYNLPADLQEKCLQEQMKPISEQQGAVQCSVCSRAVEVLLCTVAVK